MNSDFRIFRKFHDEVSIDWYTDLLKKYQIDYERENNSLRFDPSFAFNDYSKEFLLKLKPKDFEKVYNLEEENVKSEVENASKDYYLYEYSDEELQEILIKRDEWNAYDYSLAKKILKERKSEINTSQINIKKQQRIDDLKKISDIKTFWLITFYTIALMGGFFAIFIGYYIKSAKTHLPNGETISKYSQKDIKHGNAIFYLGVFCLLFWLFRGYYLGFEMMFRY